MGLGDIPVGDYNSARLANLGLGHGAIDGGLGYTYLNPANRLEFSAVVGMTYNFINPSTQYQNGLDAHLDTGASYFLTKQLNVGLVGYYFQQITGDHGARSAARRIHIARRGNWPAAQLLLPRQRQDSGLRERESLPGVRGREPTRGLERVADDRVFARAAEIAGGAIDQAPSARQPFEGLVGRIDVMLRSCLGAFALTWAATSALAQDFSPDELANRAIERRAVEAVIWGMPAVNAELMFQAMKDAKADFNQVVYWSRLLELEKPDAHAQPRHDLSLSLLQHQGCRADGAGDPAGQRGG